MKTEFLITIPDEENFCCNSKAFIEFLKIDSQLSILGGKITYKRSVKARPIVSARFKVISDKVKSSNERYFHLVLDCDKEELAEEFAEMCERLKSIIERIKPGDTAVNTLWDGAGKVFAEKSYPVINEVENLMRRLIAKFMLITVGVKWAKEAVQASLWQKIENFKDEQLYVNDLHKLDFIHLSDVLFEKKRDISGDELDRILQKTTFNDLDKERILKFVPRSNWEKYFSSLVDFSGPKLHEKWKLLYELRCKVAHNRAITRPEYGKICGLAEEVKSVIRSATEKLGEINMDEEDRELIIHTYQNNPYMEHYPVVERMVAEYYLGEGYFVNFADGMGVGARAVADLVLTRGNETVIVEIKLFTPRALFKFKYMVRDHQARLKEHAQRVDFTEICYFAVVRGEIEDGDLSRAIDLFSVLSLEYNVTIKIAALAEEGGLSIIWTSSTGLS